MDKSQVISVLELEREELNNKLRSLDTTILMLKQSLSIPIDNAELGNGQNNHTQTGNTDVSKYQGYKKLTLREKAAKIIKTENRFLHMRQIVKIAQDLEPDYDPKTLAKQIASACYTIKGQENSTLTSITVDNVNLNTFWGSKKWLNEDGSIKTEHMYDAEQVMSNKNKHIDI